MNICMYFHIEEIPNNEDPHRSNSIQEVLFCRELNNFHEGKWSIRSS